MEDERVDASKQVQTAQTNTTSKGVKGKLKKHYTGQPLFDDVLRGNVCRLWDLSPDRADDQWAVVELVFIFENPAPKMEFTKEVIQNLLVRALV